jgi:hypothetical protein
MRVWLFLLSGVLAVSCGVLWVADLLPAISWWIWPIGLAVALAGCIYAMRTAAQPEKPENQPARRYISKKHRPRSRNKKRIFRNILKRRRARKAGMILLKRDGVTDILSPGGEQVGFFG